MIAPYLLFLIWLPWAVAVCVLAGHGNWPGPDLYLMLWVYLFLRVPRGFGGYLLWAVGIGWDLLFGGQIGVGGLVGIGLWSLRSTLRLGDVNHSPIPRHPLPQGLVAGMVVAVVGYALGWLQQGFGGGVRPLEQLPGLSALVGIWTVVLWWPLCWLSGSAARLFSWDPDWAPEEAA